MSDSPSLKRYAKARELFLLVQQNIGMCDTIYVHWHDELSSSISAIKIDTRRIKHTIILHFVTIRKEL